LGADPRGNDRPFDFAQGRVFVVPVKMGIRPQAILLAVLRTFYAAYHA
jgi:hypothetical protein